MVGFVAQKSVREWLAGRFVAAAAGLDGDENRVNLSQLLGFVKAHHPAPIGFVVAIEYAQVHRRRLFALRRLALAPDLEGAGIHHARLSIQVKGIKNERLALGVKDSSEGLLRTAG